MPATVLVTVFFVFPLLIFLRYSFNRFDPGQFMQSAWTLENYIKFFSDPYYVAILGRTFAVALVATLLTLVLAFPLAYYLARMQSRRKSLLIMLVVLPLMVGNTTRAMGWIALFSEVGVINFMLRELGLVKAPVQILQTPGAVIVAIASVVLPYMILTLQAVIEGIDPVLEEAARDLGASKWRVMWSIVLPLSMPGILAGTLLVFVLCINAYSTPLLIGGPRVLMMAPALYAQIQEVSNWPFGGAMAMILVVMTLFLSAVYVRLVERRYVQG